MFKLKAYLFLGLALAYVLDAKSHKHLSLSTTTLTVPTSTTTVIIDSTSGTTPSSSSTNIMSSTSIGTNVLLNAPCNYLPGARVETVSEWTTPCNFGVDGFREGRYDSMSILYASDGYFMADMGIERNIAFVTAYYRTDGWHTESEGFSVHIGNNPDDLRYNPQCPGVHNAGSIIKCNMRGRYLGVYKAAGWLTLGEVEAYEQPSGITYKNLLYGKPAFQKDTTSAHVTHPSKGTDGNRSGEYNDGGMMYTWHWWYADLGQSTQINTVILYGRHGKYHAESNEVFVTIGDSPDVLKNKGCPGLHAAGNTSVNIICQIRGRYVGLMKPRGLLVMAEIEAYAEIPF